MTPEFEAMADRLLRGIDRIADALEERNADVKRGQMKAETSTPPERTYVGLGRPKEPTNDEATREKRRPRQSSRS